MWSLYEQSCIKVIIVHNLLDSKLFLFLVPWEASLKILILSLSNNIFSFSVLQVETRGEAVTAVLCDQPEVVVTSPDHDAADNIIATDSVNTMDTDQPYLQPSEVVVVTPQALTS